MPPLIYHIQKPNKYSPSQTQVFIYEMCDFLKHHIVVEHKKIGEIRYKILAYIFQILWFISKVYGSGEISSKVSLMTSVRNLKLSNFLTQAGSPCREQPGTHAGHLGGDIHVTVKHDLLCIQNCLTPANVDP